jgi:hypothetical protein
MEKINACKLYNGTGLGGGNRHTRPQERWKREEEVADAH